MEKEKKLAPVLTFVYSRLKQTKTMFEMLAQNQLAKVSDLYIFSDAARKDKDIDAVESVRKYISSIKTWDAFKSVTIITAERNKGLANSIINGVNEIIFREGKVIVVEDDLATAPDFLTYMNAALDFYEDDKTIGSISGFTGGFKIQKSYKQDVYFSLRACSWGWGTWGDRWLETNWSLDYYQEFRKNYLERYKFNQTGYDMSIMLDMQAQGKIDSWAIRWCYNLFKKQLYTVYPCFTKVKNIGLDGSGTNSGVSPKYIVELSDKPITLKKFGRNKRIERRFRNYYVSFSKAIWRWIKRKVTSQ